MTEHSIGLDISKFHLDVQGLRDTLYMPALVAMRHNPDFTAKYQALRSQGKPAKFAIVAIMRKLIETANALVKADRLWVEKNV